MGKSKKSRKIREFKVNDGQIRVNAEFLPEDNITDIDHYCYQPESFKEVFSTETARSKTGVYHFGAKDLETEIKKKNLDPKLKKIKTKKSEYSMKAARKVIHIFRGLHNSGYHLYNNRRL